jgi:hypothetical protein
MGSNMEESAPQPLPGLTVWFCTSLVLELPGAWNPGALALPLMTSER